MNHRTNEFPEKLFGECPNNFCRDVQEEDGTDERKWKDQDNKRISARVCELVSIHNDVNKTYTRRPGESSV